MAPNKKVTTKVGGLKRSAQTQATPDSSPRVTTLKPLPHVPAVTLQLKGSPVDVHLPHSVPTAPAVQTAPQVNHVPNVPPNVQPNIPPADVHLPPSVPTAPAVPTAPQVNHVPYVPPNVQPNIPPVEQGGSAAPGAATAHFGVPTNPPVNNAVPPQASVPEGLQPPPHLQCTTVVYQVRPWELLRMWLLVQQLHRVGYLLFLLSTMQRHHSLQCLQVFNPPYLQCKTVVYRLRPWQVLKMWRLLLELLLWVKVLVITLFQTDVSF